MQKCLIPCSVRRTGGKLTPGMLSPKRGIEAVCESAGRWHEVSCRVPGNEPAPPVSGHLTCPGPPLRDFPALTRREGVMVLLTSVRGCEPARR